jgi:Flp pilus assembly protein TadG
MILRFRNPRNDRHGIAVVELAILLPILTLLFVVAVDYARVFYFGVTVGSAARNGALWARDSVLAAESPYKSVTEAALADASNLSPTPTVASTTGTDDKGQPFVQVTVTYTFKTLTNYPFVPSTVTLARTVRMHTAPVVPDG